MKYAVLMGALAFTLCAGVCEAEDDKTKNVSGAVATSEETRGGTELKHIDVGDDSDTRAEEPVTQVGVMSPGESYNPNTGFPDVVQSDSDMDLR